MWPTDLGCLCASNRVNYVEIWTESSIDPDYRYHHRPLHPPLPPHPHPSHPHPHLHVHPPHPPPHHHRVMVIVLALFNPHHHPQHHRHRNILPNTL